MLVAIFCSILMAFELGEFGLLFSNSELFRLLKLSFTTLLEAVELINMLVDFEFIFVSIIGVPDERVRNV